MKITTTFWDKEVHEFNELFYIHGKTKEILFKTSLDNSYLVYNFFKDIAKFVKSPVVLKTCYSDEFYQFAVMKDKEVCFIKWFDLVIHDNLIISHDIAFETTLIKKNNISIPFGKFPLHCYKNRKLPKFREFNIKSKAYKFMANQVRNNI